MTVVADRTAERKHALAALTGELERLDLLIEREIHGLRSRYELSLDEFRGLYVSDQQVDALLRKRALATNSPSPESLTAAAQAVLERLAGCETTTAPWTELARRLGLDRNQRDLLLLALAPEIDPKYETLFAYLNNDVTRKWPTVELAGRLFAVEADGRPLWREHLAADSVLVQTGLLELLASPQELPRAQRGFRLNPALADWLLGLPYQDARLDGVVRLNARSAGAVVVPPGLRALLEPFARLMASGAQPASLLCTAGLESEAMFAAQQILHLAEQPSVLVDLAGLRSASAPLEVVAAIRLAGAVFGGGIVAGPLDSLAEDNRSTDAAWLALRRLVSTSPRLIVAGSTRSSWSSLLADTARAAPIAELRLPELSPRDRGAVWRQVLAEQDEGLADADVQALADRFAMGTHAIVRTVARARADAALADQPRPGRDLLFAAARRICGEASVSLWHTVETPFAWEDLVVPTLTRDRLRHLVSAVEQRPVVLDEWGFGHLLAGARGVKVLFAGASGTGKTMAAALLAKTLGLDLYRVDLSGIVSKYIGETEKNLDRAFAAAHHASAILFIDEADALFGKRSEIKDAHDRYANIEVAYLLQKMEDHDGIVLLATNLANNIDEAFSRRMHFVIEFPMPDVPSRERLWRGMFPSAAPRSDDIDFGFLARQFSFAGGDIRNIVLDAAYRAAATRQPIGMRHLLQAIAAHYGKKGKIPSATDFREYLPVLAEEQRDGFIEASEPEGRSAVP